jgi:hypothetical protein
MGDLTQLVRQNSQLHKTKLRNSESEELKARINERPRFLSPHVQDTK